MPFAISKNANRFFFKNKSFRFFESLSFWLINKSRYEIHYSFGYEIEKHLK